MDSPDSFARYPSLRDKRRADHRRRVSGIGASMVRAIRRARARASPSSISTATGGEAMAAGDRRDLRLLRPARHRRAARRGGARSRDAPRARHRAGEQRRARRPPRRWRRWSPTTGTSGCTPTCATCSSAPRPWRPMMKAAGGGLDRQLRLGQLDEGAGRHAGLHHGEGRRARADARAGARPRRRRHPRERGGAGLGLHRAAGDSSGRRRRPWRRRWSGNACTRKLLPPDIARMVLWLAADDSRMVTAQHFIVDGGAV